MKLKINIIALLIIVISGCSDKVVSPPFQENIYGVCGHIVDTTGSPVSGVKIYCLFDYGYIPDSTDLSLSPEHPETDSVFNNALYQNFPNPLSKDTYLRFSVHEKSSVELTVSSKLNGIIAYKLMDTLYYGLYQRYLAIGSNPDINNGIYRYDLRIISPEGDTANFEKEMLIINNKNKANSVSDENGYFIFNYDEAFISDTVKECSFDYPAGIYDHILSENIYLLFVKPGFESKKIQLTLYNGILFNQDVVIKREGTP